MTFFSQDRRTCGTTHFIRPCTILHATGFGLPPNFEDSVRSDFLKERSNFNFPLDPREGVNFTHFTWFGQNFDPSNDITPFRMAKKYWNYRNTDIAQIYIVFRYKRKSYEAMTGLSFICFSGRTFS
jgi:hypothetical protein